MDVFDDILNKIDSLINVDAELFKLLDENRKKLNELREYIDSIDILNEG